MSKGDETRQRILEACGRQAAARGFEGVSLSEVAAAVGLSKSGLFKHFDSKESMQLAVLEQVIDRFSAFAWKPAEELPRGRARLERVFERWIKWQEVECAENGCLIYAARTELDDRPGPLRDYLRLRLGIWYDKLTAEMRLVRDPPLKEDEARRAVFQMRSFILGHGEARRLLEESNAKRAAREAFAALLDRTSQPSTELEIA
jgi:AcrR family transcriptional regulator